MPDQAYSALAEVYDRWTDENPYARWAEFLASRLEQHGATSVLDICCGTGTLARLLDERGFDVDGVDGSKEMLQQAVDRSDEPGKFRIVSLPSDDLGGPYDAAICTFDSVNYMVGDGELATFLRGVGGALRTGGIFIMDLNTRFKIAEMFGSSHYGDDKGEFAYIWRNRYDDEHRVIDFFITLFTQGKDGTFARRTEHHKQRWFTDAELNEAYLRAGLEIVSETDDYSDAEPTETSMRTTVVLRKTAR